MQNKRPFYYGAYLFSLYWLFFVISLIYMIKAEYSLLLVISGFPFKAYLDSNISYLLNSLVFFIFGLGIGYVVDLLYSNFINAKAEKKINEYNKELQNIKKSPKVVVNIKKFPKEEDED